MYGGRMATAAGAVSSVWRLDLVSLQWESMPALVTARYDHACCTVRGSVVVIGGGTLVGDELAASASVEAFSSEEGGAFVSPPPLSCGGIYYQCSCGLGEGD